MMDQSLSWIDQAELNEALDRAGVSSTRAVSSQGEASAHLRAPAKTSVGDSTRPATAAPESSEPAAVSYEPPAGALEVRLKDYLAWVEKRTGCRQVFVADGDGLTIMQANADPDLVAVSTMFVNVLNRLDASLQSSMRGSIVIDLHGGESLHVVQAQTGLGSYTVGFAVSRAVPRDMVEGARDGLVKVMAQLEEDSNGAADPDSPSENRFPDGEPS